MLEGITMWELLGFGAGAVVVVLVIGLGMLCIGMLLQTRRPNKAE